RRPHRAARSRPRRRAALAPSRRDRDETGARRARSPCMPRPSQRAPSVGYRSHPSTPPGSRRGFGWSWAPARIEDQGGVDDDATRRLDAVGDAHPEGAHRRLKLYCVTHDTSVMEFVTKAIEEKLGRKAGSKKG